MNIVAVRMGVFLLASSVPGITQALPDLLGDQQFTCALNAGTGCEQFIPDGAIAGSERITSSFSVPTQPFCSRRGVSVVVVALHGAPGDLEIRVRHAASGTDVTQPAVTGVGNLTGNDLDRVVALPAFPVNGSVAGTWQLDIEDKYPNDYGHLLEWRVVLDCPIVKTIQAEIGGSIAGLAEPGETLRYQIPIRNDSPYAVTTTVTDPVPLGTTFAAASNGGTLVAGTVTWSLSLPASSLTTLTLDVLVDAQPPPGQVYILNRATVGGALTTCDQDANPARCDATAIVRVDDLLRDGFEGP